MSGSLQTAVLGMRAYQEMLNVCGNNLANADTIAFKEDRISFSDMFSRTLTQGKSPTEGVGGTNPVQVGRGVGVAMVDKNMTQGGFTSTERDFDLAIDGEGFFVVSDGTGELYTRDGTFDVDAEGYLVDPSSGYRVQRIGDTGEDSGFQDAGDTGIKIPYNTELPGVYTSLIEFVGNLSAGKYEASASRLHAANLTYTRLDGGLASGNEEFSEIEQLQSFADGDSISITGRLRDGTATSAVFTYGAANDGTNVADLLNTIQTAYGGATQCQVSIDDGKLTIEDAQEGYSLLDISLSSAAHPDAVAEDFNFAQVGGAASQSTSITVYDRQANTHHLSATFVRQGEEQHVWDLVITQITDAEQVSDRRIAGLTFDENGTFQGISGTDAFGHASTDPGFEFLDSEVTVQFPGISTAQIIQANFGRPGFYDGLTQLGGDSSAGAVDQDGYGTGSLQQVTVDTEGVIYGTFSNGESLEVAALRMAVFDNVQGLQRAGSNYYRNTPSAGSVVNCQATQGRAGYVRQNCLEDSNVDIAREFTNLIVAQQGYQVNARTVRVTNNILQQLASIVS
jgi:flagellar hook protein FlgE